MAGRARRRSRRAAERPIPLEPIDLLAGLAPGVELQADDLPAGIGAEEPADAATPATTTVGEAGRLIRAGDRTVRRLIRTTVLRPGDPDVERGDGDVERAGVPPRTPDKPGE